MSPFMHQKDQKWQQIGPSSLLYPFIIGEKKYKKIDNLVNPR